MSKETKISLAINAITNDCEYAGKRHYYINKLDLLDIPFTESEANELYELIANEDKMPSFRALAKFIILNHSSEMGNYEGYRKHLLDKIDSAESWEDIADIIENDIMDYDSDKFENQPLLIEGIDFEPDDEVKVVDSEPKKIYTVYHEYDEDGGFGDAVSCSDPLATFSTKEKAEEYVAKYSNPHIYDVSYAEYAELWCGVLSVKEEEIDNPPTIKEEMWWFDDPEIEEEIDKEELEDPFGDSDDGHDERE